MENCGPLVVYVNRCATSKWILLRNNASCTENHILRLGEKIKSQIQTTFLVERNKQEIKSSFSSFLHFSPLSPSSYFKVYGQCNNKSSLIHIITYSAGPVHSTSAFENENRLFSICRTMKEIQRTIKGKRFTAWSFLKPQEKKLFGSFGFLFLMFDFR